VGCDPRGNAGNHAFRSDAATNPAAAGVVAVRTQPRPLARSTALEDRGPARPAGWYVNCLTAGMHEPPRPIAIDVHSLPWEERYVEPIGRSLFRKHLILDPETGMAIRLVRYPSGVVNPRHTHPCGHGMYVLEGTLFSNGMHYGPGTFVWFPQGTVMEHGATAEGDVTVLFITNKPFAIHYLDPPSSPTRSDIMVG